MKDDLTMWVLLGFGALLLWARAQRMGAIAPVTEANGNGNGGSMVLPPTQGPSTVTDDEERGTTNPLNGLFGFVQTLMRPQTTLPGNAPVLPAFPAGPGGAIPANAGGTPGVPPPVLTANGAAFYSALYDTPFAYFDPVTGTWHPH